MLHHRGRDVLKINTTLTETVEGARTVEAIGLADLRLRAGEDDIAVSAQAERYGLTLRNLLFAVIDFAFNAPRVIIVLVGAYGYTRGWVTIGQITAAVLYAEGAQRAAGPVDRRDRPAPGGRRVDQPAARHRRGAAGPDARRRAPDGPDLVGEDLRFAYREGHDVLHGIDLDLRTGERLAIVGPSGSGKSTLGRLLSGINRPADRFGARRRRRADHAAAGGAAHRGRAGHPGALRLRRLGARQHPARPRGLRPTRPCGRRSAPSAPRTGCAACRPASTPWSVRATRR